MAKKNNKQTGQIEIANNNNNSDHPNFDEFDDPRRINRKPKKSQRQAAERLASSPSPTPSGSSTAKLSTGSKSTQNHNAQKHTSSSPPSTHQVTPNKKGKYNLNNNNNNNSHSNNLNNNNNSNNDPNNNNSNFNHAKVPNKKNPEKEKETSSVPAELTEYFTGLSEGLFPIQRDTELVPMLIDSRKKFADNDWSLSYFRAGMSANLVPSIDNGKLCVFGGYAKSASELYTLDNIKNLEAYHFGGLTSSQSEQQAFSWKKLQVSGDRFRSRAGHTAFQIPQGDPRTLYVFAGYGDHGVLGDLWGIDIDTGAATEVKYGWSSSSESQMSGFVRKMDRRWHCGLWTNQHYLVSHGWDKDGPISDMIALDWDSKKWKDVVFSGEREDTPVPSARRWHSLTQLPHNNHLFMFGGYCGHLLNDAFLGDFEKQMWLDFHFRGEARPANSARHSADLLNGGKQLLVLGGYSNHAQISKEKCWILNVEEMKWYHVKNTNSILPAIRSAHRTVQVSDHSIIVIGGYLPSYVEPFYLFDTRMISLTSD